MNIDIRIKHLRERALEVEHLLTNKEKKMIFFKSIQNFLVHFDRLNSNFIKDKVLQKIELYFQQIENNEFSYDIKEKKELYNHLIKPIAVYYIEQFHFRYHGALKVYLFIGIHIDIVLLISQVLKKIYYIPIGSLLLLFYWLLIEIFYASKNKVY